eukprot:2349444-Alexandrium_andersonii.AAC.1
MSYPVHDAATGGLLAVWRKGALSPHNVRQPLGKRRLTAVVFAGTGGRLFPGASSGDPAQNASPWSYAVD